MLQSTPFALVNADLIKVEDELRQRIASETSIFPEIAQYALFAGGKRIRPAMFLLAARMTRQAADAKGRRSESAIGEKSIPTAAVFELIHAASLLHDDVIDEANLRRGRTAVNAYWGNKKCILLGDYLFLKGIHSMVLTGQTRLLPVILDTITAMIEGEGQEVDLKYRVDVTEEDCIRISELKTAILFANACKIGAMLADGTDEEVEALHRFGMKVGVSFQVFDDILDYASTDEELGKNVMNDYNEGKPTIPLVHALANCSADDRKYIEETFLDKEPGRPVDTARILGILTNCGSLDYSRERAQGMLDEAKAAIEIFPDTPERAAMLDVGDFVLARKN